MAEIVLKNVTKRYPDGTEAVKQMNLEIADGEFVILVGPSGCGKTTALRMIAGLEDISEGDLKIGGEVLASAGTEETVLRATIDLAVIERERTQEPALRLRRPALYDGPRGA